MANEGFTSTGYDVSKTAISMASKNALELELSVNFKVQDINAINSDDHFDLIVDSSFLHCIVPDSERSKIYSFAKSSLNNNGLLFLHTMIKSEDMSEMLSASHIFLEDEILWSTGKDSWDMEWQEVQGKKVFSHRRIMSLKNLEDEIYNNGFEIVQKEIIKNDKNPSAFTGWLKVQ